MQEASTSPIVYIVDDDANIRDSLSQLVETVGLTACPFGSAKAFLNALDPNESSCLLVDVRLPEMNGVDLHQELITRNVVLPVLMMSGYSEAKTAVTALKQGAITYIEKPFGYDEVLTQIQNAIRLARNRRVVRDRVAEFESRLKMLSARESEIVEQLIGGSTTQQIGHQLNISPKTVDSHRWKILEKLDVDNVVTLTAAVLNHRHHTFLLTLPITVFGYEQPSEDS